MSALPESLRRVLAKQQPAHPKTFTLPEKKGDVTTIWRDGEVYRESKGKTHQLRSVPAIQH